VGATGAVGPTGAAGTNGTNGAVGATGAVGPTGAAGTNGTNGTNGAVGATGAAGTNGTNGAAGPTGPQGLQGTAGTNGTNGAAGPTGPQGPQGAVGATGPAGTNGTNGAVGATGPAGTNGTNGAVGATGPAGPQGPQGTVGPTGPAGTNGTNGTNGAVGATGPQGPAGTNGSAGAIGATGPQGPAGTSGAFAFPAVTGDLTPVITARTVPAGQGAANERTEMILFHSNDGTNGSGPDVITVRAPSIRLQTYNDATVSDINNNLGSNDRFTIDPNGAAQFYGPVTLASDPTAALNPVTLQYLNAQLDTVYQSINRSLPGNGGIGLVNDTTTISPNLAFAIRFYLGGGVSGAPGTFGNNVDSGFRSYLGNVAYATDSYGSAYCTQGSYTQNSDFTYYNSHASKSVTLQLTSVTWGINTDDGGQFYAQGVISGALSGAASATYSYGNQVCTAQSCPQTISAYCGQTAAPNLTVTIPAKTSGGFRFFGRIAGGSGQVEGVSLKSYNLKVVSYQ
jgi:hypothetical protein